MTQGSLTDEINTLAAPYTPGQGQITLTYEPRGLAAGALISCGLNTFKILIETKGQSASDIPAIRFNGDSAAHYTSRHVEVAATGTTLTSTELTAQTEARLGSVSTSGERVIEVNLTKETLNCTASVVQTRNPRNASQASGTMEIAGRIQWYPGSYGPLTEVKVLNVGGALFNTIKIWVFALAIPELMGS